MVASEFLDLFNSIRNSGQVGILDFSDKLNSIISVSLIIICGLIVTVKQYFQDPLTCYTATTFSDADGGKKYVNNYCWVEGTYAFSVDQALKIKTKDWEAQSDKKILYYQWVPFVLALQCILFIIPRFIWTMLTYNRTGTELEKLITVASEASSADEGQQQENIDQVAFMMENMIMASRETGNGKRATIRRRIFDVFGSFTFSKRMGTWTVAVYFLIKILYLSNAIGQIYLIQSFLGLNSNYTANFGIEITKNIIEGKDWKQTNVFPRVTFCRVPFQHIGAVNYQTSQCVLGINFINEKIYIFLWFWLVFVAFFTFLSIPLWYLRLNSGGSRLSFIKKNILLSGKMHKDDRRLFSSFTRLYLRHDGVFMLRMLALNAGDHITSAVTAKLFHFYKTNLLGRNMFDDRIYPDLSNEDLHSTVKLRGSKTDETVC